MKTFLASCLAFGLTAMLTMPAKSTPASAESIKAPECRCYATGECDCPPRDCACDFIMGEPVSAEPDKLPPADRIDADPVETATWTTTSKAVEATDADLTQGVPYFGPDGKQCGWLDSNKLYWAYDRENDTFSRQEAVPKQQRRVRVTAPFVEVDVGGGCSGGSCSGGSCGVPRGRRR